MSSSSRLSFGKLAIAIARFALGGVFASPQRGHPATQSCMALTLSGFVSSPVRRIDFSDTSVEDTTLRYVIFVMLPLWVLPGIADWYGHKQTDIENTADAFAEAEIDEAIIVGG